MPTLNLILFAASAAILFYVIRYRIHLHIEYQPRHRSARPQVRRAFAPAVKKADGPQLAPAPSAITSQLESALRNLGCDRKKAAAVALKAAAQAGDFDAKLRFALRQAA